LFAVNPSSFSAGNPVNMHEPIAYLNGQFLPISQAALSVFDLGVVAGASVTEMVRTFRHIPFCLNEHLGRLEQSLQIVAIQSPVDRDELRRICTKVIAENARLIPTDHDLGLIVFVTVGQNLTYLGQNELARARTPSICVHTFPLPFELWSDQYGTGIHLVTTSVQSFPDQVIDTRVKHRSRLHWHLADLEAKKISPGAMALLCDQAGNLTETATGNLFVVQSGVLRTPAEHVLNGVSREVLMKLARSLGLSVEMTRLEPADLRHATEAFLTSTPHCMLPVTRFDGEPIGNGIPGPIFQQLIGVWNELVGLDIPAQMREGAKSRSNLARPDSTATSPRPE
jgi:branched-chain amino acid aminotransferase